MREAERYYASHVKTHCALGELDHPNPSSPNFRSLTLDNVSHRVLDYYWEGEDLVGYVEVLSTPAGSMLKDLYLTGCQLGMSSRGWATLKERDGLVYIQEDFELITFDFVSDPSTEGAFLMPVKDKLPVPHTMPLHLICKHLRAVNARMQASSVVGSPIVNSVQKLPVQAACEDRNLGDEVDKSEDGTRLSEDCTTNLPNSLPEIHS